MPHCVAILEVIGAIPALTSAFLAFVGTSDSYRGILNMGLVEPRSIQRKCLVSFVLKKVPLKKTSSPLENICDSLLCYYFCSLKLNKLNH